MPPVPELLDVEPELLVVVVDEEEDEEDEDVPVPPAPPVPVSPPPPQPAAVSASAPKPAANNPKKTFDLMLPPSRPAQAMPALPGGVRIRTPRG
jgi:hypothetical protein